MKKSVTPTPIIANPAAYRIDQGENQQTFWTRFGISQGAGSGYETFRKPRGPLLLLLVLYESGVINDKALSAARKTAGLPKLPTPVVAPRVQKRRRRPPATT